MTTYEYLRKLNVVLEDIAVRRVSNVSERLPAAFCCGVLKILHDGALGLLKEGHGMDAAAVERLQRSTNLGIRTRLAEELFHREDAGRFWRDHAPSVGTQESEAALRDSATLIAEEYEQTVAEGSMAVSGLVSMICIARRRHYVQAGGALPLFANELSQAIETAHTRGYIRTPVLMRLRKDIKEFDLVVHAFVAWKRDRTHKKKRLAGLPLHRQILHYLDAGPEIKKMTTEELRQMLDHIRSSATMDRDIQLMSSAQVLKALENKPR